jgi:hypothetical protein
MGSAMRDILNDADLGARLAPGRTALVDMSLARHFAILVDGGQAERAWSRT